MGTWLAKTPLGSAAKTFLAFVLAAFVADAVSAESINFDNWQVWVIGALASAVPPIIAWLDPNDTRWGRGAND